MVNVTSDESFCFISVTDAPGTRPFPSGGAAKIESLTIPLTVPVFFWARRAGAEISTKTKSRIFLNMQFLD
jgi:hypothetical protein